MVNMTLAVSEDLHHVMKQHSEIKWSEVARRAIQQEAAKLALMDKLLEKGTLTEQDAIEIAKKIKRGIARKHGL